MDAAVFDALSRVFSAPGTRRRLLGLVATLPLLGGVAAWLDAADADAKERRRRRKQRHKRRKKPGNRKHGCKPQSKATTCAGQCGPIKTRLTCGKTVDCGSCGCPTPCGVCLICQSGPNTPGACVPDAEQVGDPCGSDGQLFQSIGACACGAATCANPTPICTQGACAACAGDGDCVAANAGDLCCAGLCYEGVCCAGGDCQDAGAPDCVDHDCVCTSNGDAACAADETCCAAGCFDLQHDTDHCGACQTACSNPTHICASGTCEPCTMSNQCPDCQMCDGGECVADASLDHHCTTPCPSGEWCEAGACASIQATVNLIDCQGMCNGSTAVCGQTVTCPDCDYCWTQTGCSANELQSGPLGHGSYCSQSDGDLACTTNAQCASHAPWSYCTMYYGGTSFCSVICPN